MTIEIMLLHKQPFMFTGWSFLLTDNLLMRDLGEGE